MRFKGAYLTLWVALCIIAGIGLGQAIPAVFRAIGAATVAEVNLPVAVLVWLMIVPMLLKIDLAALGQVGVHWRGIAVTVGVNWLVKPFSMALLGWLFIAHLFRPFLPADQIDAYIAGLILLAAAPCTAMVFVWSNLVEGEPHFTLSQVALNDSIMIVAFAPIVALLLGLSSIVVPWNTLLLSVVLYIVVPVIAAQLWRRALLAQGGKDALNKLLHALAPLSLSALLLTLVLLFGLQGEQIIRQPLAIGLLAVPILIQVYFNAGLAAPRRLADATVPGVLHRPGLGPSAHPDRRPGSFAGQAHGERRLARHGPRRDQRFRALSLRAQPCALEQPRRRPQIAGDDRQELCAGGAGGDRPRRYDRTPLGA
jgi:ACR3 family arsenite transporter